MTINHAVVPRTYRESISLLPFPCKYHVLSSGCSGHRETHFRNNERAIDLGEGYLKTHPPLRSIHYAKINVPARSSVRAGEERSRRHR